MLLPRLKVTFVTVLSARKWHDYFFCAATGVHKAAVVRGLCLAVFSQQTLLSAYIC